MAACSSPSGGGPGATAKSGSSGGSSRGVASGSSGSGSGGTASSSGTVSSSGSSSGVGSSGSPVPDANADETQSGSRLKANYFVGGDGSKQFAGYFTDTAMSSAQCNFVTAADGTIRCLPTSPTFYATVDYYSNAACTVVLGYSTVACTTTPPYAAQLVEATAGGCVNQPAYHVYTVTASYTGTIYFSSAGACTAITTSPTYSGALPCGVRCDRPTRHGQSAGVRDRLRPNAYSDRPDRRFQADAGARSDVTRTERSDDARDQFFVSVVPSAAIAFFFRMEPPRSATT